VIELWRAQYYTHPDMPSFQYEAATLNGETMQGSLEAVDRRDALRQLEKMDLQPLKLVGKESRTRTSDTLSVPRLSSSQIILFTEDLCDLLDAGLQLDPAMSVMEKRQSSEALRITANRIRQQLREGSSFSRALHHGSPSFSQLYCSIAEAGEAGGSLPKILRHHVIYLNALSMLRAKAIQSLIYPAFIMGAGCLVLILFVTNLAPQLDQLFQQTGTPPPVLTQMLMGASRFFLKFWWAIGGIIFMLGTSMFLWTRTAEGHQWWGKARYQIPGFGPILQTHFLAQFSKTLASLLANGIPLLASLKLVRNGVSNPFYGEALDRATLAVGDGAPLSMALKANPAFPPLFLDLLTVGEQTGKLAHSLEKASDRFEKEMDIKIRRVIAMIGPVVIIVLAFVVAVVTYSVITSIFEAVQGVRTRF
jgi:general secretion pathway protein F/type IV pilus assembly protein PilC